MPSFQTLDVDKAELGPEDSITGVQSVFSAPATADCQSKTISRDELLEGIPKAGRLATSLFKPPFWAEMH